jgi:hypothetical protein
VAAVQIFVVFSHFLLYLLPGLVLLFAFLTKVKLHQNFHSMQRENKISFSMNENLFVKLYSQGQYKAVFHPDKSTLFAHLINFFLQTTHLILSDTSLLSAFRQPGKKHLFLQMPRHFFLAPDPKALKNCIENLLDLYSINLFLELLLSK